jgi:23S rRNA (cytidine1920-2'-O)/16S rRNA (cytidine1409-2'-O)-methyltransferase
MALFVLLAISPHPCSTFLSKHLHFARSNEIVSGKKGKEMFPQQPDGDKEHISSHGAFKHSVGQAKKIRPRQKISLAALLVEHGYFTCLDEAQRWIMAGKVIVNNHRLDKPGMLVSRDAVIRIRGRARYASRAGYKLEAALEHFAVDVSGRITLDCGASTGGFTDCLLQHGAALVYAVDAGHGQLIGRLRLDSRVCNLEQTNLSSVTLTRLAPRPSLITLDLSYLSLTRALPVATALLTPQGRILALVKPLFEVENSEARRTGHIEDSMLLVTALQQVIDAGVACGLAVQGVAKLALQPRHGVHEFFVSFVRHPGALSRFYDAQTLLALIEERGIGRTEEE